jgi:hypothetical protein
MTLKTNHLHPFREDRKDDSEDHTHSKGEDRKDDPEDQPSAPFQRGQEG